MGGIYTYFLVYLIINNEIPQRNESEKLRNKSYFPERSSYPLCNWDIIVFFFILLNIRIKKNKESHL